MAVADTLHLRAESLPVVEYRLVDDEIKKIISVEVFEYDIDPFSLGGNASNTKFFHPPLAEWLETEEASWLKERWLEQPQLISVYNAYTYEPAIKVFVRLYEEDAVFHALKWK